MTRVLITFLFLLNCFTLFAHFSDQASWNRILNNAQLSDGFVSGNHLKVDELGNMYVVGSFRGNVDFDPGSGTALFASGESSKLFFAKYNAAGKYLYVRFLETNKRGYVYCTGIDVDKSGSLCIGGSFGGTVDFDPSSGNVFHTSKGETNIFFAKYDPLGNYVFSKSLGSKGFSRAESLSLDRDGNIYIAGSFKDTVDFDPSAGFANLICSSSDPNDFEYACGDSYFAKYDASGNYIFAKSLRGLVSGRIIKIIVDDKRNVHLSGFFEGKVDFDPGASIQLHQSGNRQATFFSKYDSSGNYMYAHVILNSIPFDMVLDSYSNVYITGSFSDQADFDPGSGYSSLESDGFESDIYFAKYTDAGNYVFARRIGGEGGDAGLGIGVDAGGNVYLVGVFSETVDFVIGPGVGNMKSDNAAGDLFLAKYDAAGNKSFVYSLPGQKVDFTQMVVNTNGDIYLTGNFKGTVDFDLLWGSVDNNPIYIENLTSTGREDLFIVKYNRIGYYDFGWRIGPLAN